MNLHVVMYRRAKKDSEFVKEFCSIKGNEFSWFDCDIKMALMSSAYYGWLAGKYGMQHAEEIKLDCKRLSE